MIHSCHQKKESGLGFIPFIDILFSLIGIIILFLCQVQLNMGDLISSLSPKISEQMLRDKEAEYRRLSDSVSQFCREASFSKDEFQLQEDFLRESLDRARREAPSLQTIQNLKEKWENLRKQIAELERWLGLPKNLLSKADLQLRYNRLQQESYLLGKKLAELEEEILARKKELGSIETPRPQELAIPVLQEISISEPPLIFVCRNNRLTLQKPEELRDAILDSAYQVSGKRSGLDAREMKALENFLAERVIATSIFRIRIRYQAQWGYPSITLILSPIGTQGESCEEFSKPDSIFQRALRNASSKSYIQFLVYSNGGFEPYVHAQKIVQKAGLRSNWIPFTHDEDIVESVNSSQPSNKGYVQF